jgi:hypothetical protein
MLQPVHFMGLRIEIFFNPLDPIIDLIGTLLHSELGTDEDVSIQCGLHFLQLGDFFNEVVGNVDLLLHLVNLIDELLFGVLDVKQVALAFGGNAMDDAAVLFFEVFGRSAGDLGQFFAFGELLHDVVKSRAHFVYVPLV